MSTPKYAPSRPTFGQLLGDAQDTLDRIEKLYDQVYRDGEYTGNKGAADDAYAEADHLQGVVGSILSDVETWGQ